MARQVTRYDDVIDSRDVIERIEELEDLLNSVVEERAETGESDDGHYDDERDELAILKALEEEASSSPDWRYGAQLIRDSYFREYAEELADDIGIEVQDAWPYRHIDWEAAAHELQQDYQPVDFDGVTYWIRY